MRLIQLQGTAGRRVGIVEEPHIRLIEGCTSIWELAQSALADGVSLSQNIALSGDQLDYDGVYNSASDWRILPAIDHPHESARCLVSGTGLSHIRSATNRQNMHSGGSGAREHSGDKIAGATQTITDSMRMYEWGVEGGRPAQGAIGVSPEWFYKGTGSMLRGHNDPLEVPTYAEDGGEEPEIAGVYIVDPEGNPRRIGMATGNEFSDHVFEKKNYLYLASSKLRTCSIGPELTIDPDFSLVTGEVSIHRAGAEIWRKSIRTGEQVMCHSLANMEHHHFKFAPHRRPGDIHVHYFGADAFSFGEGIRLQPGDVMEVHWHKFGRPLRNTVQVDPGPTDLVSVRPV